MGGLVTVVAALVAVVGVLIARGLFDVPVLAPTREGALGDASTARLALLAAVAAVAATGLMHLLLVSTPPFRFFTWIVSLLTLVAALAPFMTDAELDTKVATAAIQPGDRSVDRLADLRGRQGALRLRRPGGPFPAA